MFMYIHSVLTLENPSPYFVCYHAGVVKAWADVFIDVREVPELNAITVKSFAVTHVDD